MDAKRIASERRRLTELASTIENDLQTARLDVDNERLPIHKLNQITTIILGIKQRLSTRERGRSYDQHQDLARQLYEQEQAALESADSAQAAKAKIEEKKVEIERLEGALRDVQVALLDNEILAKLHELLTVWDGPVRVQYEIDRLIQHKRELGCIARDIGIDVLPHPGHSFMDPRLDAIRDYITFLVARMDPDFGATLPPNHRVHQMIEVDKKAPSSLARPIVAWV